MAPVGAVLHRRRGRGLAILAVLALLALVLFSARPVPSPSGVALLARDQGGRSALPDAAAASPKPKRPPPPSPRPTADQACAAFPWIEPALEQFFEPARQSAAESLQTTEESLAAMDEVEWVDGYHPGHELVTLRYNSTLGRYDIHTDTRSPHNRQYKRDCLLSVLAAAVEAHGGDLARRLRRRELRLVFVTEDFGMTWRGTRSKLPSFALCTDDQHIDIPVPDFTFGCYPETRYRNSSWPAVAALLEHKGGMLTWPDRHAAIVHRSNWGVGPRRGLMPLLQGLARNGSDVAVLGAQVDVADTGFIGANREHFVWMDAQCDYKYHIHTAGFSYSAQLKYRLACGAVVIKFDSKYVEFFEPALRDGVHLLRLPAREDGVDEEEFFKESAPKIKRLVEATNSLEELPAIAAAGQAFALNDLSPAGLHCYWYQALLRYAELYFMEQTAAQAAAAANTAAEAAESEAAAKQRRKEGGKDP